MLLKCLRLSCYHSTVVEIHYGRKTTVTTRTAIIQVTCLYMATTLSPVSTGMGDRLRAGIPPWYVTKPTRSTQRCIPLGR